MVLSGSGARFRKEVLAFFWNGLCYNVGYVRRYTADEFDIIYDVYAGRGVWQFCLLSGVALALSRAREEGSWAVVGVFALPEADSVV